MNESVVEASQITVVLIILGNLLKGIPKFPNQWIPLTLVVLGTAAYIMLYGWSAVNLIWGIQTAAASTGLNQLWQKTVTATLPTPAPAPTVKP